MPTNLPHQSHLITLSFSKHITASMTQETLAYCKTYGLWYAAKHETRADGTLHFHIVYFQELITAHTDPERGHTPKSHPNRRVHFLQHCPSLATHLLAHPVDNKHGCQVITLVDSRFNEYFQKQGDCVYYNLPEDQLELIPYMASKMAANNVVNKDLTKWSKSFFKLNPGLEIHDITHQQIDDFVFDEMTNDRMISKSTNDPLYKRQVDKLYSFITKRRPPAVKRTRPPSPQPVFKKPFVNKAGGNDPNWDLAHTIARNRDLQIYDF